MITTRTLKPASSYEVGRLVVQFFQRYFFNISNLQGVNSFMLSLVLGAICLAVVAGRAAREVSTMAWNVTVSTTKGVPILSSVCGTAHRGRLHALIGPSGCGKTTLLNVLAGEIRPKQYRVSGVIRSLCNGTPIYVQQEDLLFSQLTARETLETTLSLATKGNASAVSILLGRLGLERVQDVVVGDSKTRGLSGGEKKRLSIGNEIILSLQQSGDVGSQGVNSCVFADEPTSGLDCFQAEKVIALLRGLAVQSGSTVLVSVHQPRSSVQRMFDDVTLLSEAGVVCSGPTCQMRTYFESIGHPCPSGASLCEFCVDLVSVDSSSPEAAAASRERVRELRGRFQRYIAAQHREALQAVEGRQREAALQALSSRYQARRMVAATDLIPAGPVTGLRRHLQSLFRGLQSACRCFLVLNQRAWRQVLRDKPLNIARLASSLFSALMFGAIYFRLSNSAATVPDRLGLLQVAAVNTAMSALIKASTAFVTEQRIVDRERRRDLYSVLPYFAAKMCAELPLTALYPCLGGALMYRLCGLNPAPGRLPTFLAVLVVEAAAAAALGMSVGAVVPTVESAIAVAPAVMVIFIVFGGLYVVNAPAYLAWAPQVSLIRWAYQALCVNEFSGLPLIPTSEAGQGSAGYRGGRPGRSAPRFQLPRIELRWGDRPLFRPKHDCAYSGLPLPAASTVVSEQVLQRMGFAGTTVKQALQAQAAIVLANYLFTYVALVLRRPHAAVDTEAHREGRQFGFLGNDTGNCTIAHTINATTPGSSPLLPPPPKRVSWWPFPLSSGWRAGGGGAIGGPLPSARLF